MHSAWGIFLDNLWISAHPVCQVLLAKDGYIMYTPRTMSQTYQPKRRKRNRVHGFLARMRTVGGRRVIRNRRRKGRAKLSV